MNIDERIAKVFQDLNALRAVFVTGVPHGIVLAQWQRKNESWSGEDLSSYFVAFAKANEEMLRALSAKSAKAQTTILSETMFLVIQEVRPHVLLAMVFAHDVPLGLVRMDVQQILTAVDRALPTV